MSELLRLLVVEDNPGDLGLIQQMLPASGPCSGASRGSPRRMGFQ